MLYEVSSATDKADLFARFKNFVGTLTALGWAIDKQTTDEIYVHNASNDYFGIKLQTYTSDYFDGNFSGFACLGNTGFDTTKNFYSQPGSLFSNFSPEGIYDPYTNWHHFLYIDGFKVETLNGAIYEYVFCADEHGIYINLQPSPNIFKSLFFGSIQKSHNFIGGAMTCATEYCYHYNSGGTSRGLVSGTTYNGTNNRNPFMPNTGYGSEGASHIFNLSNIWRRQFALYSAADQVFFSSTMGSQYYSVPFSLAAILGLGTSMYSALNALVTPQYFYQNVSGKFVYAGNISGFKIVHSQNLSHGQHIFYGEKEYLILKPSPQATYYVAVEL